VEAPRPKSEKAVIDADGSIDYPVVRVIAARAGMAVRNVVIKKDA
jgi:hypothetical protein